MKTHLKWAPPLMARFGCSDFDLNHHTACGFFRGDVTKDGSKVNCKLCLKSEKMETYIELCNACLD